MRQKAFLLGKTGSQLDKTTRKTLTMLKTMDLILNIYMENLVQENEIGITSI